jgi:hypothetical protein
VADAALLVSDSRRISLDSRRISLNVRRAGTADRRVRYLTEAAPLRSAKRRRNPIPPTSSRIPATPVNGRRSSMAKGSTTNLAEQNAERAMYAANHGMDWMREIAERSLNQSRTMFEEFLTRPHNRRHYRPSSIRTPRALDVACSRNDLQYFRFCAQNHSYERTAGTDPASKRIHKPPSAGACRAKQGSGAQHCASSKGNGKDNLSHNSGGISKGG